MYPYPSYGAAGPVSGGLQGRQGRVENPCHPGGDTRGKGVKTEIGTLVAEGGLSSVML